MKKSIKNRKIICQTKRNYFANEFYKKKIKVIQKKLNYCFLLKTNEIFNDKLKIFIDNLLRKFFSILDKATKKNVIHKNKVNRKKKRFSKQFKFFFN